jgi:hypothetical protein
MYSSLKMEQWHLLRMFKKREGRIKDKDKGSESAMYNKHFENITIYHT